MLGGPHQVVEGTDVVTNDADTATIGRLAGAVAEAYGAGAGEQMDWRHVICGLRCVCVHVCAGSPVVAVHWLPPASPRCPVALPLPPRLPPRCYTCTVLCCAHSHRMVASPLSTPLQHVRWFFTMYAARGSPLPVMTHLPALPAEIVLSNYEAAKLAALKEAKLAGMRGQVNWRANCGPLISAVRYV